MLIKIAPLLGMDHPLSKIIIIRDKILNFDAIRGLGNQGVVQFMETR